MPRYKLVLEYDGSPFKGWQRQRDVPSVQQTLEEAIARFSGEAPVVHAAGRTDTGVHALGQVVHFDLDRSWESFRLREALNFHLRPAPVVAVEVDEVDASFEARFSAIQRHYEYRILNRRAPSALERRKVWHVPIQLDSALMDEAAQTILGSHDFTTFRAAQCQAKSPMKTLDRFDVRREGQYIIVIAEARSFLHHQVRSMVGSLKMVGEGKWPLEQMYAALDARDRSKCGAMAPPDGLYLTKVIYP